MNARQTRALQAFRRAQGWFAAHRELLGDANTAPALKNQVDALNQVVDRLTNHATDQGVQLAQTTLAAKDEKQLRAEVLSHHIGSIAKVARALRGQVPGIGVLTAPAPNVQSEPLVRAAQVFARKAAIYEAVLVEHGLPRDFVAQLDAATAALEASIDGRGKARSLRAGATQGVQDEIALGRRVIAIIDANLARLLRGDPVKLAEWQHAKRVTMKSGASRVATAAVSGAIAPLTGTIAPDAQAA